jgi:hypothetical protein
MTEDQINKIASAICDIASETQTEISDIIDALNGVAFTEEDGHFIAEIARDVQDRRIR